MGVGLIAIDSANTTLYSNQYVLQNPSSVYSKTDNTPFGDLSCEAVVIIESLPPTNIRVTSYNLILYPYTAGTCLTIVKKPANGIIVVKNTVGVVITVLEGVDMCKLLASGGDNWVVLFNQTAQIQSTIGVLYGHVKVRQRTDKTAGVLRMSSSLSEMYSENMAYTITDAGIFTINNNSFTGCIQLEMLPLLEGYSATDNNQTFSWNISTVPSKPLQIKKNIITNKYGYTPCSLLALIDMNNVTSVTISITSSALTGSVDMLDSDIVVTSLPTSLINAAADEGVPSTYVPLIPPMTSNTTPAPFVVTASSENSPAEAAYRAFNTSMNGWVNATSDPGDVPEITVYFGEELRVPINLVTITSLPLPPISLNMTVSIYGAYRENGVDFLALLGTVDNIRGNVDGTSKNYDIFLENSTAYNNYTLQITFYESTNNSKAGFRNIQFYNSSFNNNADGIGGSNALPIPQLTYVDPLTLDPTDPNYVTDSTKLIAPPTVSLPDIGNRAKYYFNQLAQNTFDLINPSDPFNVINIDSGGEQISYLMGNGPDFNKNIGKYDYYMKLGPYLCVYRSLTSFSFTCDFGLNLGTKISYVRGDPVPMSLQYNHTSPVLDIILQQSTEIMRFTNKSNRRLYVSMFLPVSFTGPLAQEKPRLSFYINGVSYPYNATNTPYSFSPASSMTGQMFGSFNIAPFQNVPVQIVNESVGGTVNFTSLDASYYLGIIQVY